MPNERLRAAGEEIISYFGASATRARKPAEILALEAFYEGKKTPQLPPPPSLLSATALARRLSTIKTTSPNLVDLSELPLGDAGVTQLCAQLLSLVDLKELRLPGVAAGARGAGRA